MAAAKAIADGVTDEELNASYIVPSVFEPHVTGRTSRAPPRNALPETAANADSASRWQHCLRLSARLPTRKDTKWPSQSQIPGP